MSLVRHAQLKHTHLCHLLLRVLAVSLYLQAKNSLGNCRNKEVVVKDKRAPYTEINSITL